MTIFYFIIGLGLLIFIHELGHFLVAKANGIRVERFSLGFGPRLLKFQWGETEYCLSLLPLGGYVKMTGQEDFGEEDKPMPEDPRAFSSKSLLARLSVVFAGPAMNLILPFIIMPIVFLLGRMEPSFLRQSPQIIGVEANSSAAAAGLKSGDHIVAVDEQPVKTWEDYLRYAAKPDGKEILLQWKRGEQSFEQTLVGKAKQKGGPGFVGIEPILFIDQDPVVGEVMPGSPAQVAGLQEGDRIITISELPIDTWDAMSEAINASKGKNLSVTIQRNDKTHNLTLTPNYNEEHKKYVIGVSKASNPNLVELVRYPLGTAIKKGAAENLQLFQMTFKVLKDLVTLQASYKDLGGPIRIAQISAKAAEQGIGNFLFLLCFLSIQLGILNLLPIPVLDGGHILFMLYEAVAKKPLSVKTRMIAQQVGLVLLLTLMVVVTFNDIDSVWGFKDIIQGIKGWFG